MTCWTKQELENMLEDVINELDLSLSMIQEHGQHGTAPAALVRLVLESKDMEIRCLKRGFEKIVDKEIHIRPRLFGSNLT